MIWLLTPFLTMAHGGAFNGGVLEFILFVLFVVIPIGLGIAAIASVRHLKQRPARTGRSWGLAVIDLLLGGALVYVSGLLTGASSIWSVLLFGAGAGLLALGYALARRPTARAKSAASADPK